MVFNTRNKPCYRPVALLVGLLVGACASRQQPLGSPDQTQAPIGEQNAQQEHDRARRRARERAEYKARLLESSTKRSKRRSQVHRSSNPSMAKLAQLPEQAFVGSVESIKSRLLVKLRKVNAEGIALAMPSQVDLFLKQAVPMVWLHRASAQREQRAKASLDRWLLVSDPGGRGAKLFSFDCPRKATKRRPSSIAAQKLGSVDGHFRMRVDVHDFRRCAQVPWQPASYAVTGLNYNWRTKTNLLELRAEPTASQLGTSFWRDTSVPSPGAFELQAARWPEALVYDPLPEDFEGALELKGPERVWSGGGSLQLEIRFPMDGKKVAHQDPLQVSLFFVKKDGSTPAQADLRLPPALRSHLTDHSFYQIKLFDRIELGDQGLGPGEYMVYAVFGDLVGGPLSLSVLNEGAAETRGR